MPFSREVGFLIFRIAIPTLLLGIQYLLYIKLRNHLRQHSPHRPWLLRTATIVFVLMNVALAYVLIRRPSPTQFSPFILYTTAYPFFLWHGATLFIGLALIVSFLIKSPFKLVASVLKRFTKTRSHIVSLQSKPAYATFDSSRRRFVRSGMYGLTAASFGASAYGMFVAKHDHEIIDVLFRIRNLPAPLSGFTIALVSDIHSSINMVKADMDSYVGIVNSLGCDMILVTGDFVNSMTEEVYPFAEAFSNLRAPHGVYGVMGNHDFFAPQPELVAKEIDGCGVTLLRNDKVVISKNGGSFYLIGVDDVGRIDRAEKAIETAVGYAPLNVPKLLMIHRPYFLQQAADAHIDLVFSGHTHGGQVVFAQFGKVTIAPAALASRYVWGRYRIANTQMYINRGLGTVGLPIRLNCPPEITKMTLMSA